MRTWSCSGAARKALGRRKATARAPPVRLTTAPSAAATRQRSSRSKSGGGRQMSPSNEKRTLPRSASGGGTGSPTPCKIEAIFRHEVTSHCKSPRSEKEDYAQTAGFLFGGLGETRSTHKCASFQFLTRGMVCPE